MAIVRPTRTAAVLTSRRNARIARCRHTATTIAVPPSRVLTIRPRLALTVRRLRASTQNRGHTLHPELILRRPGAIRRRLIPIPHRPKVTAVVVVTGVAVAAATEVEVTAGAVVVAAEVHVAAVPLRIH